MIRNTVFALCGCLALSCGKITFSTVQDTQDNTSTSSSLGSGEARVFVFAGDFQSSGQLYVATLADEATTLQNSGITQLGTEAIIRYDDGLLYILHAGANYNSVSSDNLQIVDPFNESAPFKTLGQYSTGNGTNPLDAVISGNEAFVSLYNPAADKNNVDEAGDPADVITIALDSGEITRRYSFQKFLDEDGDKQANAYCLLFHNGILYVCLQDLESNTFSPVSPGLIGMIDVTEQKILGVITLSGRNPSSLAIDETGSRLFVSMTHEQEYNSSLSGLEIIDLQMLESELFIADSEFGGYIEKLKQGNGVIYAVVSKYNTGDFTFKSKIVQFLQDVDNGADLSNFKPFTTDIRDIFYQNGFLWVAYRVISTSTGDTAPALKIYDVNTGKQMGESLYPAVPGLSFAGPVTVTEEITGEISSAVSEKEDTAAENDNDDDSGSTATTESENSTETTIGNTSASEPALDESDVFLSDNDEFFDDFASDSGFGYDEFPNILYGPPVDVYDVVSFGTGGSLSIKLNGYLIVNGDGPDFTVFENPFTGWQECAEISVSEDGISYETFDCNQYDTGGVFAGCAGVTSVNYGLDEEDYLDPEVSGGDFFDLSDLGANAPETVRYIKLTDVGRCSSSSAKSASLPSGFDLDAIALLNGINEI